MKGSATEECTEEETLLTHGLGYEKEAKPLGKVIKYKARLCVGGHKSIEFVNYWSTYSPVVSWQTIRLIFKLAIINKWSICSIDFVLAYPQAKIKTDIFLPQCQMVLKSLTKVYRSVHECL